MKGLITTIVIIAILGLFTFTNPKMDDYKEFIEAKLTQKMAEQQPKEQTNLLTSLATMFAGKLVGAVSTRQNFILFSVYETGFGSKHIKTLGILGNFVVIAGAPPDETTQQQATPPAPRASAPGSASPTPAPILAAPIPAATLKCKEDADFQPEDLSALAEWNGKYTDTRNGRKGGNFFQVPAVRDRLQRLLTTEDYKKLVRDYGVEAGLDVSDGYLTLSRCMPHFCGGNSAKTAIRLNDGAIAMVFSEDNADFTANTKHCYASGTTLTSLPARVVAMLLDE